MRRMAAFPIALCALLSASAALAQSSIGTGASSADATGADTATEAPPKNDRGAFVAGGKVGGIATLSGLGVNVTGAVEVGYIFPWVRRSFGLLVDVGYAAPVASGTESDPRVAGGSYEWTLTQKQLTIAPTILYRYTGLGKVVPFVGVGPRILLLEGVTEGKAGSATILENKEQSTKVGVGVPLGAEYLIGPGAALAELLFQYSTIDHKATGDASLTSFTLWLGYRFML